MRKKRCLLAGIWFFSIVFGFLPVRLGSLPVWVDHLTDREKSLEAKQQEFNNKVDKINLPFIENQGQMDERVDYYANIFTGSLFVTGEDLTYTVIKREEKDDHPSDKKTDPGTDDKVLCFKKVFLGKEGNPLTLSPWPIERSEAKVSYFKGNDPDRWRSNIPTYSLISLGEVYPDIEIRLKAYGKNVEKLFYLNPGADPQDIRIKLAGIKDAHISKEGELILETEPGDLLMSRPWASCGRRNIRSFPENWPGSKALKHGRSICFRSR
ncbi:hypothetical protein KKC52_10330, partial [bacterium]|nr:hypothetical protein [bacterium]